MMPLHPPGRNVTETLKEDREAILLADRLGFSEAYVGEHVTDAAETVTSSLIFLASLASQTKQIKLGTGTINLPNAHPAAIAAQVAMLDHLLEGRFIMVSVLVVSCQMQKFLAILEKTEMRCSLRAST